MYEIPTADRTTTISIQRVERPGELPRYELAMWYRADPTTPHSLIAAVRLNLDGLTMLMDNCLSGLTSNIKDRWESGPEPSELAAAEVAQCSAWYHVDDIHKRCSMPPHDDYSPHFHPTMGWWHMSRRSPFRSVILKEIRRTMRAAVDQAGKAAQRCPNHDNDQSCPDCAWMPAKA